MFVLTLWCIFILAVTVIFTLYAEWERKHQNEIEVIDAELYRECVYFYDYLEYREIFK